MVGIYITSSERGAGKTAVAASLAALLKERGESVGYFKPVALIDDQWASDHDTRTTFIEGVVRNTYDLFRIRKTHRNL